MARSIFLSLGVLLSLTFIVICFRFDNFSEIKTHKCIVKELIPAQSCKNCDSDYHLGLQSEDGSRFTIVVELSTFSNAKLNDIKYFKLSKLHINPTNNEKTL